jgi:hypothetical protein
VCFFAVTFGIGFAIVDLLLHVLRMITDGLLTVIYLSSTAFPVNLLLETDIGVRASVASEVDFDHCSLDSPIPYRLFARPVQTAVVAMMEAGLCSFIHSIPFPRKSPFPSPSWAAT